jgi:predicted DNA-binding transcriptional regulator AlpA
MSHVTFPDIQVNTPIQKPLRNLPAQAAAWGLPVSTLREIMKRDNPPPHVKIGNRMWFADDAATQAWLDARRHA